MLIFLLFCQILTVCILTVSYTHLVIVSDDAIGLDVVDKDTRVKYRTVIKESIKKKVKKDLISEEMRLLYVAMTRAREKLYLVGCVDEDKMEKYKSEALEGNEKLSYMRCDSLNSYFDMVMPAVFNRNNSDYFKLKEVWAVSYTHLDVYKRQSTTLV